MDWFDMSLGERIVAVARLAAATHLDAALRLIPSNTTQVGGADGTGKQWATCRSRTRNTDVSRFITPPAD